MARIKDRGRVLILQPGLAGDQLAGPEIRGWETARVLAEFFDVTVAGGVSGEGLREGIRVVPHRRTRLLREIFRHDVVIAAWLPPFILAVARLRGLVTVADLYDPVEFELPAGRNGVSRELLSVRELTRLQVAYADIMTCGARSQLERLEEARGAAMRSDAGPRLLCVPFGVPPPPAEPRPAIKGLRARFEPIAAEDVVALWWGSVWHWLDAETPLRAMERLKEVEPRLKLVLSVGPPPDHGARGLDRAAETRDLAKELGLLGKSVFFLEEWIPYYDRAGILLDADIGITCHRNPAEAAVAVRARYLDLAWCSVPMVLTPGDEIGNELVERGAALPASPGDIESTAEALRRLASQIDLRRSAALAAGTVADERRWSKVVEPLVAGLQGMLGNSESRPRLPRGLLSDTLRFYLARTRDKLLELVPRGTSR